MDSLYIVIPAYNEEETIQHVIEQWYPILNGKSENSRLVIADSGSTDRTHDILLELQHKYPQICILSNTLKQHGPKLIAMYKYAINEGIDYIFQTDSDGQTDPNEFAGFWDLRNKYDVILGERIERGDGKSRAFVEKIVCLLLYFYFRVRVPDANAPFRLMKADVVNTYIDHFQGDYNLPNIMLTAYFAYYHENVLFCQISFKPRQGGVNSINIPKIIKIGWKALGDFRQFKTKMQ